MLVFSILFYAGVTFQDKLFPSKENETVITKQEIVHPTSLLKTAKECLAMTVFHEARNQPEEGQLAVAMVVLNRAKEKHEPICKVAFEPKQFSWANDIATVTKKGVEIPSEYVPKDDKVWKKTVNIATAAFNTPDFTHGATFYHTKAVKPYWRKKLEKVTVIGDHIFYRRIS